MDYPESLAVTRFSRKIIVPTYLAGIISNIPGGLGVFETVILLTLSSTIPSIQLLGSLLAYRVIYYWIPLILGILGLGGYELKRHFSANRN